MASFELDFLAESKLQLEKLSANRGLLKRFEAVHKALGLIQRDPRHPGLRTHKFHTFRGPRGEDVFQSYAENQTPGAYRIFWHYGPGVHTITILAITPHP
jgi:hypothetical protein